MKKILDNLQKSKGVKDVEYVPNLDATSNSSHSIDDIPLKIRVVEISRNRKAGPTLRSRNKSRRLSRLDPRAHGTRQ